MLADSSPAHHDNNGTDQKPYFVPTRKERSRELAQKRRNTYKSLMNDVADVLPFSKEVVSQIDYNSRLRLAMCFIRMKKLLGEEDSCATDGEGNGGCQDNMACTTASTADVGSSRKKRHSGGLIQNLLVESLDGFLLTCLSDGTIIHISDSIHRHLGLFQSEHIGFSLYDLVHEDDHYEVKDTISRAEAQAIARMSLDGSVKCSFFCRMKCSKTKLCNSAPKSQGYKLVYIAGQFKLQDNDSYLIGVVHPVSPPSILEVRMEGNMFVTHYTLDMRCTFFDGRLKNLMGFEKQDLVGHVPFQYHHHEDVAATLECSKGLMERGEGLSGYYRYINKYGTHVWMQSRGIMMFDSRTGKPSYIVCMNYVISKEKGEAELASRQSAITSSQSDVSMASDHARSFDPFPTPRDDNLVVDPFEPEIKAAISVPSTRPPPDHTPSPLLDGRTISPTDSRGSPDITLTPNRAPTNLFPSEDLGYSSSISHSSYLGGGSSVVSPQSVQSSVTNDDLGSCCNSVFNGSPLSQSPDPILPSEHLVTASQPQQIKPNNNGSLLAKLLTSETANTNKQYSVDGRGYVPVQPRQLNVMNDAQHTLMSPILPPMGQVNVQFISYNVPNQHQPHAQPSQSHFHSQPYSHAAPYSQLPKLPVLTIEDIQLHTSH